MHLSVASIFNTASFLRYLCEQCSGAWPVFRTLWTGILSPLHSTPHKSQALNILFFPPLGVVPRVAPSGGNITKLYLFH